MFKSGRLFLLIGAAIAAPAAAQLLGGQALVAQPLAGTGQVVSSVGQAVGDIGQVVSGLGQTVGGVGATVDTVGQQTGQVVGKSVGALGEAVSGTIDGIGSAAGGLVVGSEGTLIPQLFADQAVEAGGNLNSVTHPIGQVATSSNVLFQLRQMRHQRLLTTFRTDLEAGDGGIPIVRGHLLLTNPTNAQMAAAGAAGYAPIMIERDEALDLTIVTVTVPPNQPARIALRALTDAIPGIPADVDPLFEPAGSRLAPAAGAEMAVTAGVVGNVKEKERRRIVMIDGGVAAHPAMARATIEQKGFAGRAEASGHGTAVASLLVGDNGAFRGAARGTALFVADIYGGNPAAGAASAIVRALSWAATKKPDVVTMSLVGPPNMAIERAIGALRRQGVVVVAAVGNDGPAAPPAYPASYAGVVAVTGVDARGRALAEAGRPRHLDFAAPGAEMAAALPGDGYADVRGTSFATPLVAARIAAVGSIDRLSSEAVPGKGRVGRGIICFSCRIAPSVVGVR